MRYFEVLGFQHFAMYLFPAIAFIALFIIALGFYHIKRKDSAERESRVIERFPEGIEGRNAPFPIIAYLVLCGTIIWVIAYIVLIGVLEVKI
jgi:Na+/H+ antiporter NhaC